MFLSPDRFSGRSSVTLVKMNFKPHIRQNYFFKKNIGHQKFVLLSKQSVATVL